MFLKLRSGFDCELSTVQCQLFICLSYRVGQALAWPLAENYFFRLTIPPVAADRVQAHHLEGHRVESHLVLGFTSSYLTNFGS